MRIARENIKKLGLDVIIGIGSDDTLSVTVAGLHGIQDGRRTQDDNNDVSTPTTLSVTTRPSTLEPMLSTDWFDRQIPRRVIFVELMGREAG